MRIFSFVAMVAFAAFAPASQQSSRQPDGIIQGSVLQSGSRAPVPSASVTLSQMDGPVSFYGPVVFGAFTDREGRFTIDHLPPGKYTLAARRSGFFAPPSASPDRFVSGASMTLTLAEHENRSGLDFILIPEGAISGRILDPFGLPAANRTVQVAPAEGRGMSATTTDDRGQYRVYGLAPGSYRVSVIPPRLSTGRPQDSYPETFYPGTTDASAAVPIVLGEGGDIRGIDFRFQSTVTVKVSGRVETKIPDTTVTPNGIPAVRNYSFNLVAQGASASFPSTTQNLRNMAADRSGGKFELTGVRPGVYDLIASFSSDLLSPPFQGYTPITVGYVNLDNVLVHIDPGVSVTGVAKLSESAGPSPFRPVGRIKLIPIDSGTELADAMRLNTASINEAGQFLIPNVPPGRYSIGMSSSSEYLEDAQQDGRSILAEGLSVGESPPAPINVVFGWAATLSGAVIQGQGPGARLTIALVPDAAHHEDSARYQSFSTTSKGTFSAEGVKPGEYMVFATEGVRAEAFHDATFLASHAPLGQHLLLSPSMESRAVSYRVADDAPPDGIFKLTELPTAIIEGTLRGPAGEAIGNASVVLIPEASQRANPMMYFTATTSAAGAVRMPNVLAGNYTLIALQDLPLAAKQDLPALTKYAGSGEHIVVTPDSTLGVTYIARPSPGTDEDRLLALTPSPPKESVSGRVIAAPDKPVNGATVVLILDPARGGDPAQFKTVKSSEAGAFSFPAGLTGPYILLAFDRLPAAALSTPGFISRYLSGGRAVALNSASSLVIDLHPIAFQPNP